MKKPLMMFIITALLIVAGAMAYQAYKHGAFKDAHGVNMPAHVDVEEN